MSRFFRRRKFCRFTAEGIEQIDYKDLGILKSYITETGKVVAGEIEDIAVKVRAQVIAGIPESDLKTTLDVIRAMQANLQGIRGI